MESILTIVDYLLIRDSRAEVLFFVLLYCGVSTVVGAVIRNSFAEALLIGLLVFLGSGNLTVFLFRYLGLDLAYFGWFVLALAFAIVFTLRMFVVERHKFDFHIGLPPLLGFVLLASAVWLTQILTTEPAAGMSSHQAWYPLYLGESFSRGYFLTHEDMQFSPGFMASLLFNVDLLGIAAFGAWVGADAMYAPFLAAAISSVVTCAAIFVWGVRENTLALIGGVAFFLLYFRIDPDFLLMFGSNWGDFVMYVAGAAMLYYMMLTPDRSDKWILVALAALFMPFGRNFGVLYAALICAFALAMDWRRHRALDYRAWGTIFVLGCIFSGREIFLIFASASPYYDPGRYLFEYSTEVIDTLIYNIGIDTTSHRSIFGKILYAAPLIACAAALLLKLLRPQSVNVPLQTIISPLFLFVPPVFLVLITGSYGGSSYNKLFAMCVFLHVFYVWRLAALADIGRPLIDWSRANKSKISSGIVIASLLIGFALFDRVKSHRIIQEGAEPALSWAFETYRGNNADLMISRALNEHPELLKKAKERPILYMHYEPGLTLRYFIGGNLFADFDYWSDQVFDVIEQSNSFQETVRRLGDPLVYVSFGTGLHYGRYTRRDSWDKFADEIGTLDNADWIADKISAAGARLYFPDTSTNRDYGNRPQ